MEKIVEKLKKFRILIIIAVLLIAGLVIFLVTRPSVGGDEEADDIPQPQGYFTDTPYAAEVMNENGQVEIKINYPDSPGMTWTAAVNVENTVNVSLDTESQPGKAISRISPVTMGYATVSYTLSGSIGGIDLTPVIIDVGVMVYEDDNGSYAVRSQKVSQNMSISGALDSETPYIINGNRIIMPNGGDWTIDTVNKELPDGLYLLYKGYDEDGNMYYDVIKDMSVFNYEDGEIPEEIPDTSLILKSESLGYETRLNCIINDNMEWILVSAEDKNVGENNGE